MTELPEPFTPANCDLRGMPFMPLDVVRLRDSDLVALSSGPQFKAAVLLWCFAWHQVPAASLPDDERILARAAGCSPALWRSGANMALRGWVKCRDGRLYHPVIAEKARKAWNGRQRQRAKANKRWREEPSDEEEEPLPPVRKWLIAQALNDATALPERAIVRGTGIEIGSVPKGTARGRSHDGEGGRNRDAWRLANAVLRASGQFTEAQARGFFGKLLTEHRLRAAELMDAVTRCEQAGTPDPKGYLTQAAREISDAKAKGHMVPSADPLLTWGSGEWRAAMEWREEEGRWPAGCGPEPGEPDCLVPPDVLIEFGFKDPAPLAPAGTAAAVDVAAEALSPKRDDV
jgi:hypothetical protein